MFKVSPSDPRVAWFDNYLYYKVIWCRYSDTNEEGEEIIERERIDGYNSIGFIWFFVGVYVGMVWGFD